MPEITMGAGHREEQLQHQRQQWTAFFNDRPEMRAYATQTASPEDKALMMDAFRWWNAIRALPHGHVVPDA